MKIKYLFFGLAIIVLFAFKSKNTILDVDIIGKYGELTSQNSANPSYILEINADHTFRFQDPASSKNQVYKGTWNLNKRTITLFDPAQNGKVLAKWKLDDNNTCVKSRIGMAFYTLCNSALCN